MSTVKRVGGATRRTAGSTLNTYFGLADGCTASQEGHRQAALDAATHNRMLSLPQSYRAPLHARGGIFRLTAPSAGGFIGFSRPGFWRADPRKGTYSAIWRRVSCHLYSEWL